MKLEEPMETLCNHYEPKVTVVAERFHFHKREQHEGESVAASSAALKMLRLTSERSWRKL